MAVATLPHKGIPGKGTILTLDLGTKTGWAILIDGKVISGSQEWKKAGRTESPGRPFARFRRWLDEVKTSNDIRTIYYEEVRRHLGTTAGQVYGGYKFTLLSWADENAVEYESVPVGSIKIHTTGKGNAGKSAMIAAMEAKGHKPMDDNEADALAILYWVMDGELKP
ncbi:MAG: hypothetical protein HQL80_07040 [Magnetococcales bacterium]|nr:hypothetical protein [Magnetococcales bacterium]MBF0583975.1 hypothetical protein [Magnetococcales bacterium]